MRRDLSKVLFSLKSDSVYFKEIEWKPYELRARPSRFAGMESHGDKNGRLGILGF